MVTWRRHGNLVALGACLALLGGCVPAPSTAPNRGAPVDSRAANAESTAAHALSVAETKTVFPWVAAVEHERSQLTAEPGETWSVDFALDVDLSAYVPEMGEFEQIILAVFAERRYDEEGTYRAGTFDFALSSTFTTTGVPIEIRDQWPSLRLVHKKNGSPFEGVTSFELADGGDLARVHRFEGRVEVAVPPDIAPGYWEPRLAALVKVQGVDTPIFLATFYEEFKKAPFPGLPLVAIGRPATPQMPWTAFSQTRDLGRVGTLPEELQGKVALRSRTRYPAELLVRPGVHRLAPGFPELFPRSGVPSVGGSIEAHPKHVKSYYSLQQGTVSCTVEGPSGTVDLGSRAFAGAAYSDVGEGFDGGGLALEGGPFMVDMTETGAYRVHMKGHILDTSGRRFEGGGTYLVHSAMPLSFSTSVKPGMSFLTGNAYPAKVNVNPPVPAEIEVTVEYYPQSDPARKQVWKATGRANGFGHFTPRGQPPIVFDEPGEYSSVVRGTYRDRMGRLWMKAHRSSGVVAGHDPMITLHGMQRNRDGLRATERPPGEEMRYDERLHHSITMMLLGANGLADPLDPALPYYPEDTLFIQTRSLYSLDIEMSFSMTIPDERLARLLLHANTIPARAMPRKHQKPGPWTYLENVLLRGFASGTWDWSPTSPDLRFEIPVSSASRGELDPINFPEESAVDAYVYVSAMRPGFLPFATVLQKDGYATFWCMNPNAFGGQINAGVSGDRPGDIYRVQAGLVLKDHETGAVHHDSYGAALSIVGGPRFSSSVSALGERPLLEEGGRQHYIFLATDTHDALELGEPLGFGGMVFPNVPAEVTWTVTRPSGEQVVVRGQADSRGAVRGTPLLMADEPGLYRVQTRVRYDDHEGGIPGTNDGNYWVAAVPRDGRRFLETELPGYQPIDPLKEVHIPLRWPEGLRNVKIDYGIIMPGRVIEEGTARPTGNSWRHTFSPMETVIRVPNYEFRDLNWGHVELADTVVFQYVLEAENDTGKVHDAIRVVLRGDKLMNFDAL